MAKGGPKKEKSPKASPYSKSAIGRRRGRVNEIAARVQIESPSTPRSAILENSILHNRERVTDNQNPLPTERSNDDIGDPEPLVTAMPSSSASQNMDIDQNGYLRQNQNNLTDTDYLPLLDDEKCTESITKFLATSMQPNSLVEEDSFKKMVKTLNPHYCMPQRKYFSDTAIPKLYTESVDKLKEILAKEVSPQTHFSITCDSWTSGAGHQYMAISVHYVNASWDLISACLNCVYFEENCTARTVRDTIRNKLEEWGLDDNCIVACTADNVEDIVNGVNFLNINHVHCLGHSLNVAVNHAIEIIKVQKAVRSLKLLQNAIARSWDMKRELRETQELLEYDVKELPSACPNRWLSTLRLCKTFLENRTPISIMLQNFPEQTMPDTSEIFSLEKFVQVASVLQGFTEKLSSENYVTSSVVLPLICQIKNDISIDRRDEILFANIKDRILDCLTCYEREPLQTILGCSTFVDPRFKLSYFHGRVKRALSKVVYKEVEALYNSSESFISGISKSQLPSERVVFEEEYHNTNNSKERALQEVQEYLSIPIIDMDASPLQWWHDHELHFPKLSKIAKKYLCIQGSSVPSERVFSTSENVIDKIRCSISPNITEMQIFLACNKKILEF